MANPALPAPAILRRQIQDALCRWLQTTTGLGEGRVVWDAPELSRRTFPFATLAWSSSRRIGSGDSLVVEDLGVPEVDVPDVRLHATGLRRVVITAQVFDLPSADTPEADAFLRLDAAAGSLDLPGHRDPLIAAGFGVVSVGDVRRVAPGQVVVDIVGHVSSDVTEDTYSVQRVGFEPGGDLDVAAPFDVEVETP